MKFSADAGKLASALALASSLAQDKLTKKIPALGAACLTAGGGSVTILTNNLDASITLTTAAVVVEEGKIAVPALKLAALAAGFPKDAAVMIASDMATGLISSGRSRFKLETFPIGDLPSLAMGDETGRTVIARDDAVGLFRRPVFAMSTEQTRFYLTGLLLHDLGGDLAAVATDGHRLARYVIPGAGTLSADRRCIVPAPTVKVIAKLLSAHRDAEEIVLRRSPTLVEIGAPGCFRLTAKLIDAIYPHYERVIGTTNDGNTTIVVDRADLVPAFTRIAAVAGGSAVVGLTWPEQGLEGGLRLCAVDHGDAAHDVVGAKAMSGAGRIAFKGHHGLELLDAFDADTITINAGDAPGAPIRITDSTDPVGFLVVQMPCAW